MPFGCTHSEWHFCLYQLSKSSRSMKTIILFSFFLLFVIGAFAQSDLQKELEAKEDSTQIKISKVYYGGYLNLSFGTYTVIGAQPLIAYKVSSEFSLGTQLTYEYFSEKIYDQKYSTTNYGISVFGRYRILPQLYAHAEYSAMKYDLGYYSVGTSRKWVPFLFLGGGYSQPISQNVWMNAQILFDVLQNENSPYPDWEPFYSIGFGVGF